MWSIMEYSMIIMLIVTVLIGFSEQQSRERCLYSRLEYLDCPYQETRLIRKFEDNEYIIHYTNLQQTQSGGIACNVKQGKNARKEKRSITTVGTEDMKILFSPGFINNTNYDDQLLVDYRVKCREGDLAFFNVTTLDLQGRDCIDEDKRQKCQDYLLLHRGMAGTTELCGNTTTNDSVLSLQSGEFDVTFRSSEEGNFTGFQMYVICFRPSERDMEGCLRPENFTQPVCNGSISSSGNGNQSKPMDDGSGRKKRQDYAEGITYSDIFHNYPPGLKVRKDVANFHRRWLLQKRQAIEDSMFIERIVFFNESVIYTKNTIRITDPDDVETARFEDVLALQTFDANGDITDYVGDVNSEVYNFFGPGPLIITGRYAYLQLFIIDPRGLIPNPEEERDLEQLNGPLLASVNTSEDNYFNDTNPTKESLTFLFGERRKRDAIDDTQSVPQREKRQEIIIVHPSLTEFSEEAVFVVLRNLEACNPVLRSQARTSLKFYQSNETTRDMLEEIWNFTINCTSNMTTLECSVDEGFAPALDSLNTTYCTFNDTVNEPVRQQCNPFYGGVDLTDVVGNITSATVEAINCNGQRVKHIHHVNVALS